MLVVPAAAVAPVVVAAAAAARAALPAAAAGIATGDPPARTASMPPSSPTTGAASVPLARLGVGILTYSVWELLSRRHDATLEMEGSVLRRLPFRPSRRSSMSRSRVVTGTGGPGARGAAWILDPVEVEFRILVSGAGTDQAWVLWLGGSRGRPAWPGS